MRNLMPMQVNLLYTFQICFKETGFKTTIDSSLGATWHWDEPVIDESLAGRQS